MTDSFQRSVDRRRATGFAIGALASWALGVVLWLVFVRDDGTGDVGERFVQGIHASIALGAIVVCGVWGAWCAARALRLWSRV